MNIANDPVVAQELHILILEDVPTDAELIERELRRAGIRFAARRVETQEDFVKALDEFVPDMILADYRLPTFDGLSALMIVRERFHEMPFIFITGAVGEEVAIDMLKSGATDYVLKDRLGKLVPAVKRALREARELLQRQRAEEQLRRAAAAFDNMTEAIVIAGGDRRITAVNHSFTWLTGYAAEEIQGLDFERLLSEMSDAATYQDMWAKLESAGRWRGETRKRRKDGETFPAWESISVVRNPEGRITGYVCVFSDITVIKRAEEHLRYLAHHDVLTGLPNRLAFAARLDNALARAKRHNHRVALLYLDLDRFKQINDTLGHEYGDRLLQVVAARVRNCVRAEDTVARLGGDEFVVILAEIAHPQDAAKLARKIGDSINQPIRLDGQEIVASASIGISVYPDDAATAETLIKAADAAMYVVKQQGRNAYRFYADCNSRVS